MKIDVTQEDIDRGVKGACTQCPVALALARAFPDVYVDVATTQLLVGDEFIRAPSVVSIFIEDFDDGEPVQPFSFDLDLPPVEAEGR